MFRHIHTQTLVVLAAAVALGGLTAAPALGQCEHFHPQILLDPGPPNAPESVAMGDLDGDGDGDLAISHFEFPGTLTVMFNAGDGTFPQQASYDAGFASEQVAIGELDGQPGLDIVVVNYDDPYASIYLNDGAGVFTPSTTTTDLGAYRVAIGDVDSDGDEDLVIAFPDMVIVGLYLNNGDGTFTPGDTYATTGSGPYGVAVGELDGVNGVDIVATNLGWSFDQFLNNGDGTFTHGTHGTASTSYTVDVTIADVDNDGDNDLGMAHWWGGGAGSTYLNNGDATYVGSAHGTGAWACEEVRFAELDGQPGPELIILNQGTAPSGAPPGVVSVFTNDGAGHFSDRCNYDVGDTSVGLAAGDLNGDLFADVVVANFAGGFGGNCSLLMNQGGAADLCGDANCDGIFNGADIDPFFLALGDPNLWIQTYPNCDIVECCDINYDGLVNGADIDPFFTALGVGHCP